VRVPLASAEWPVVWSAAPLGLRTVRARSGDPLLTAGYDGATSAPLTSSTDDRQARTVRWEIPRIVLSEAVDEMLGALAPLAGEIADGLSVDDTPRGRF
jgi:hypothetical protein